MAEKTEALGTVSLSLSCHVYYKREKTMYATRKNEADCRGKRQREFSGFA